MKVSLSTIIDLPPDEVWQRVQTPQLLLHIAAPLVRFRFNGVAAPATWAEAESWPMSLSLFGFLPFGIQWIVPSVHTSDASPWPKRLRDNGHSALIKTWDHWITVEPDEAGGTLYRDEVEVRAGLLTPFIWLFAQAFYRHRQRRWRALPETISKGTTYDRTA